MSRRPLNWRSSTNQGYRDIINLLEKHKLILKEIILSIGPGANIVHSIDGASTEAQVDVVRSFWIRMQEYSRVYDAALKKDINHK